MPSKKRIDSCDFKNASHESNDNDEVTLIYCKTYSNCYTSGNSKDDPGLRHKWGNMVSDINGVNVLFQVLLFSVMLD